MDEHVYFVTMLDAATLQHWAHSAHYELTLDFEDPCRLNHPSLIEDYFGDDVDEATPLLYG